MKKIWRNPVTIVLFALNVLALLLVPFAVWIAFNTRLQPDTNGRWFGTDQFLNTAMWFQVAIGLFTLFIISFGAFQVIYLKQQVSDQRLLADSELFYRLTTPEFDSAKRFLASPEVQDAFESLNSAVGQSPEDLLSELRNRLRGIGEQMHWPLLSSAKASLDHIELLLDHYNYLSKLILEGKIETNVTTSLTLQNFKKVYCRALPLIKLRQKMSHRYALDFENIAKKQA